MINGTTWPYTSHSRLSRGRVPVFAIRPAAITPIPADVLARLSVQQLRALTPAQVRAMTSEQLAALSPRQRNALN